MWYEIINSCLDKKGGVFGSTTWAPYKSSIRFIGRNVKYDHLKLQINDRTKVCSWTSTFYCVLAQVLALQRPADSVCSVCSCKSYSNWHQSSGMRIGLGHFKLYEDQWEKVFGNARLKKTLNWKSVSRLRYTKERQLCDTRWIVQWAVALCSKTRWYQNCIWGFISKVRYRRSPSGP